VHVLEAGWKMLSGIELNCSAVDENSWNQCI
jgi:hypothetical protein